LTVSARSARPRKPTGNDVTLSGGATVAGTTVTLSAATGAFGLGGTLDATSAATLSR